MKIGILTYHRVINDGSIIQAYCTQQVMKVRYPEARVEIIDVYSKKLRNTEFKKLVQLSPPFIRRGSLAKKRSVDAFVRDHLTLSSASRCTDSTEASVDFIREQNYDLVLVGSDTVWEARFSPYSPTAPNVFYLPEYAAPKASFAASSDPVRARFTGQVDLNELRKHIENFDFITYRDEATHDHLLNMGVGEHRLNFLPDPTFQYDFGHIVPQPTFAKRGKIVGISIGGEQREQLTKLFKDLGYSILDFNQLTLDGELLAEAKQSVVHRLSIYRSLDFMISDRFHGSILSFKLNGRIPTVFLETASKWPQPNSKGRDLFARLNISPLVIRLDADRPEVTPEDLSGAEEFWKREGQASVAGRFAELHEESRQTVDRMLEHCLAPV